MHLFAQVPDKDKVRLDTHGSQFGLTGSTKHPLEEVGVIKNRMVVPDLGIILPVVIVVRNISLQLILGMDLLQIYGANVDARMMQVSWAALARTCLQKCRNSICPPDLSTRIQF